MEPSFAARAPAWQRAFEHWDVAASPDRDEAEWWAGAPSVTRDGSGAFWMAARMRTADAPLGLRGYEIRIYRSDDGVHFAPVHSIRREDVPIAGFERPALVRLPESGRFRLYGCGPVDGRWCVVRFDDADRPDRIVPSSARPVITAQPPTDPPGSAAPSAYKDPVVLWAEGMWHCFVIGILGLEQTFHFVSADGEAWQPFGPLGRSVLPLAGWHNYAVRPASVLPLGVGYLFVYEGSSADWRDPSYNIATGLAYSPDLRKVVDLTPDEPFLVSPTPGRLHVWRYSHWTWVGDTIYVYAEVEKMNGAHEIRVFRLPALLR